MAKTFKVPCPSCEADISAKVAQIGKKIDCPKCKYRFAVPDPDATEDDDAPSPKKKGKKKGSPMMLVGILLGVLAVGVLAVGGVLILGGDSGSSKSSGTAGGTPKTPVIPAGPRDSGTPDAPPAGGPATGDAPPADGGKPGAPQLVAAGNLKDPTNLLPTDSSAVLRINMDRLVQTPLYSAMLDPQATNFFKNSMTFDPNDIESAFVCLVDPDREPFTIIRTKVPLDRQLMFNKLDLTAGPRGRIQDREYFLIKSNAFISAMGRALSTESLLGETGLPMTDDDKKRWKEKPLALCLYDNQTLFISEKTTLERYLDDLGPNGDPPFQSKLTSPEDAPPPPGDAPPGGEGGDGRVPPPGGAPPGVGPPMGPAGATPGAPGAAGVNPGPPGAAGVDPRGPMGQGGGSNRPPPKLYTTIPTYRTVKPELKQMLNRLEEDEKNKPAMLYADSLKNNFYSGRDLSAMQQIGLAVQSLVQNATILGIAVTGFNQEKLLTNMMFSYVHADDAKKSIDGNIMPLLNLLKGYLSNLLGTRIDVRAGQGSGGAGPAGGAPGGFGGGRGGRGFPGGGGDPDGGGGGAGPPPPPPPPPPPGGGVQGPPGDRGGFPGDPGGGGQPSSDGTVLSFLEVTQNDTMAEIRADITWNGDRYRKLVLPAIASLAAQLKGRMQVLSGDTTIHSLSDKVQRLVSDKKAFPAGTLPREERPERYRLAFPPDKRSSFLVDLLPFMGQGQLYNTIDTKRHGWYEKENLKAAQTWVPEFLVPYYPQSSWRATHPLADGRSLGGTNYVGMAGLGLDAARYDPNDPVLAKKVGVVGYDWGSKVGEIKDGITNTIHMIQVPPGYNRPWMAGGGATVQGVDENLQNPIDDFVHTAPDKKRGTYALMADGSVRWLSADIDPNVFKALVTRAGGEAIPDLNKVAPKVETKARTIEIQNQPAGTALKVEPLKPVEAWTEAAEAEVRKFQGQWKPTMLVFNGEKQLSDVLTVLKAEFEFDGRRMTLSLGGEKKSVIDLVKLNADGNPKIVETMVVFGPEIKKSGAGVYEFIGDRNDKLHIRLTLDGKTPPKVVKQPEEGSKDVYLELARIRE